MGQGQQHQVFQLLKNGPPKEKSISVYVYAIFRIFSLLHLAIRQPVLMGNHCYMSQILLSTFISVGFLLSTKIHR